MLFNDSNYKYGNGYKHLASGLTCGLSSLAAGFAIGIVGDAGVRANAQEEKIFVGMILILIFGEALGLYGMIVAIILSQWTAKKVEQLFIRRWTREKGYEGSLEGKKEERICARLILCIHTSINYTLIVFSS